MLNFTDFRRFLNPEALNKTSIQMRAGVRSGWGRFLPWWNKQSSLTRGSMMVGVGYLALLGATRLGRKGMGLMPVNPIPQPFHDAYRKTPNRGMAPTAGLPIQQYNDRQGHQYYGRARTQRDLDRLYRP